MTAIYRDNHYWVVVRDGDWRARALYRRHYSCYHYKDGRKPRLFVGPGEKIVLLNPDCTALFVWRKFIDDSGQHGVNCSVFRNEGSSLSSEMIKDATMFAWNRWPGSRLYTYVNPQKIKSTNPGYCFLQAGWQHEGYTQKGLLILAIYQQQAIGV